MCRFVVDEHEVDDVGLADDEDDFEDGVPDGFGRAGPEEICRSDSAWEQECCVREVRAYLGIVQRRQSGIGTAF